MTQSDGADDRAHDPADDRAGNQPDDQPDGRKPVGETIKEKLDELEVEKQLHKLVDESGKLMDESAERAGGLAHDKRDDVAQWLEKATGTVNEKTKGQYADQVERAKAGLLAGLDKLASRRRLGDPVAELEEPDATGSTETGSAGSGPDVTEPGTPESNEGGRPPHQGEGL